MPLTWARRFLTKKPVVYASCSLGASLMHSVFSFYYVKIYLDHYGLPESWFHGVQTIYMVWNAVNDPLIGYLQDTSRSKFVRSRRHTILYGAPVWAATFLLPWFPLAGFRENQWLCGVHMVVALCAYDTLFTHVLLAQGCVLAEMTSTHGERVMFYMYRSVGSAVGSAGVLFSEQFSHHLDSFGRFQAACVLIAVAACGFISYTGLHAVTKYDTACGDDDGGSLSSDRSTGQSLVSLTGQVLRRPNFFWFVLVNFCAEFSWTFVANMSRVISAVLVKGEVSSAVWSVYCGALMVIPKLVQLPLAPVLHKVGYYRAYNILFVSTIVLSTATYLCGFSTNVFVAFTLLNSALSGLGVSLMDLPMADIIEEDRQENKRKHPISSMVFGTNALITKPALSLAPMLAVVILNKYGYREFQSSELPSFGIDELKAAMFDLTCCLPLVVSAVQFVLWSRYTIKQPHLAQVTSHHNAL